MSTEVSSGSMSLLSWKVGQTPNPVMILIGSCCTCCIVYYVQLYNVYKELNRFFPDYDISMAIFKSIVPIWSWLTLDSEMSVLAQKAGVTLPTPKIPAIAGLLCGLIAPFTLADQMERVTILCKAVAERANKG